MYIKWTLTQTILTYVYLRPEIKFEAKIKTAFCNSAYFNPRAEVPFSNYFAGEMNENNEIKLTTIK